MAKNQEIFRTKSGRIISLSNGSNTISVGTDGSVITGLSINVSGTYGVDVDGKISVDTNISTSNISIDGYSIQIGDMLALDLASAFSASSTNSLNISKTYTLKELIGTDHINIESNITITLNGNTNGIVIIEDY